MHQACLRQRLRRTEPRIVQKHAPVRNPHHGANREHYFGRCAPPPKILKLWLGQSAWKVDSGITVAPPSAMLFTAKWHASEGRGAEGAPICASGIGRSAARRRRTAANVRFRPAFASASRSVAASRVGYSIRISRSVVSFWRGAGTTLTLLSRHPSYRPVYGGGRRARREPGRPSASGLPGWPGRRVRNPSAQKNPCR